MVLVDTHCHIHSDDYPLDKAEVLKRAREINVGKLICVGTDTEDTDAAVMFAQKHRLYSSIGIHPHEAKDAASVARVVEMRRKYSAPASRKSVVAVGECGLDYFYNHSGHDTQIAMLHEHIQMAQEFGLPLIFHVRDAFDDFWPVFDSYHGLRGVLHSFTDGRENMEKALERGLYIGVNGISTFTKDQTQQQMFAAIPVERLLLETDAPYLTPIPLRGRVNEPAFVTHVAQFHADLRTITLEELSVATSQNATTLFNLN